MNLEEYDKMYREEEYSWWFRGRQRIVEALLRKHTPFGADEPLRILDLGCGTGKILKDFCEQGHEVFGADISDRALSFTAGRGAELLARADATQLPLGDNLFDLAIALDILEHVEDDNAMAAELTRVLKPGGHLLLTVPAHPFLWSEHDEALHHFRRYTKQTLRAVLDKTGMEWVRFTPSISAIFPVAASFRLAGKAKERGKKGGANGEREPRSHMFHLPKSVNAMLTQELYMESRLIQHMNMPMGLSLTALMRKSTA